METFTTEFYVPLRITRSLHLFFVVFAFLSFKKTASGPLAITTLCLNS